MKRNFEVQFRDVIPARTIGRDDNTCECIVRRGSRRRGKVSCEHWDSSSAQLRESTRYSGPLDPVVIATDARGVNALRDYFQQDVATADLTEYLRSKDVIEFLQHTNFDYTVFYIK